MHTNHKETAEEEDEERDIKELHIGAPLEETYGFTQNLEMRVTKPLSREQKTMTDYLRG